MKCSICNAENPLDAKSCHQCGFSLSLSQPTWPDFPTVEVPEPTDIPQWPELPGTEAFPVPPEPIWPGDDALVSIESVKVESVADMVEDKEEAATVDIPPPDHPSEDDELARSHITRGFKAIREELYDQAKWEFEQARDLADDPAIVHMAQAQLGGLYSTPVKAAPEQARSPSLSPPTGGEERARQVPPRPIRTMPLRRPSPPSAPIQIRSIDWNTAVRFGLIMGVLNGILTGCTAVFLVGFLLAPLCGFVAGWLTARYKTKTGYTVHENDGLSDIIQAVIAGGIAGIGGWLGQVIGCPIWIASLPDTQTDSSVLPFVACLAGGFYIPMSAALGALGWRVGRRKA